MKMIPGADVEQLDFLLGRKEQPVAPMGLLGPVRFYHSQDAVL